MGLLELFVLFHVDVDVDPLVLHEPAVLFELTQTFEPFESEHERLDSLVEDFE